MSTTQARFINAQQFTDADKNERYKVRYSATPEKQVTRFDGDDGRELVVRLIGEKVFDIGCTPEVFAKMTQFKFDTGSMVEFVIQPSPSNMRVNLITDVIKK